MSSNFSFLENNKHFQSFAKACLDAERSIAVSPPTTAILARRALELAVKWVYSFDDYLEIPYRDNLSSLIHNRTFKEILTSELFPLIKYIVSLGNLSAHTNNQVSREEAVLSLRNLHQFVSWIGYCYSSDYIEAEFDESILATGQQRKTTQEELKKLYDQLGDKDEKLQDIISENEKLRAELRQAREEKLEAKDFEIDNITEAETRKRYIDLYLKEADWTFGDDCIEEYQVKGMPNNAGIGYVDYLLFGANGKPLAVVEAKRTTKDPKDGKQQAKLYADCLEQEFGQRPVIFYTNGFETYIWDDTNYPERRVSGFYTKDQLQLMVDRRTTKVPLDKIEIKDEISNRYYQKEAIKAVCEEFTKGDRRALLVMATGSGKTRTSISIVDVLSRHNWVKNILFLADRTALVKQAKKNFNNLLPNMSLCNLVDDKDNPESRIVFSTYPTMMNAIDEAKTKDGKKLFTVGHFDLIIVDESHRSIYKKYQAIFDYFDALLIGLTATPKSDLDKNTYEIFNLEDHVPTYAYELEQAVNDKYLVYFDLVETKLKFLEEGISYDELSDEDKEKYEETFDDEMPDFISNDAINSWLYNEDTIDKVITMLMEKGIKVEGGDKLGKTIIFARNHRHAVKIVERFNALYPEYKGDFARVIDNHVNYSQDLIEQFGVKNSLPQIAVSVDMMDTGIDVPEIVNLVFFKKVRSKAKFWQMIGRGTRLCEDLFGVGQDKERFLIFDFGNNFEFFRVNAEGKEVRNTSSLTEKIFNTKVNLVKELQHLDYQEDKYINYRKNLISQLVGEVINLNRADFRVKQNLRYVVKFEDKKNWNKLGDIDVQEIKEFITPLIKPIQDDEMAKRFDYLMLTIELADLVGNNASRAKTNVIKTANSLSKIGTIPQVLEQREVIEQIKRDDFWSKADINDYEEVREALRDLIKFIEKKETKIYYTNFTEQVLETKESSGKFTTSNLENYRDKVDRYIKEHQNYISIHKLKANKKLTEQDFIQLEKILWNEVGTKEDYQKEFGDTPLAVLVREIIGLDQKAANRAFSQFLNDENLDSKQIRFVKKIVDYVVENGLIRDKKVLQEEPFRSIGSITQLFPTKSIRKIVDIIDEINNNAMNVM
ncbi:DEAD/DEAH box helicase [Orenia metallireducens]|uniref:DEAD/DEAH box helicase n=1 Tax=Orenia metallireducens TaxID=1413210 RepID=A0A1C0AB34_9FIRM|nr:DEAD/DEAH box helicase family protein [Orenia metallireducens]OCL27589.1 DEAD/DEAH box helicase [Orenia metallireducens]